jgi:hypothetical protein
LGQPDCEKTLQAPLFYRYSDNRDDEENNRQTDGDIENRFLNASSGGKNRTAIVSCKTTQTNTFILQNYGSDQGDRYYNQDNI